MIHRNKRDRLGEVVTKLSCGQNKRDISIIYFINIFILFIYFSLQRLIIELGKLSIDPLAKIIIFFL